MILTPYRIKSYNDLVDSESSDFFKSQCYETFFVKDREYSQRSLKGFLAESYILGHEEKSKKYEALLSEREISEVKFALSITEKSKEFKELLNKIKTNYKNIKCICRLKFDNGELSFPKEICLSKNHSLITVKTMAYYPKDSETKDENFSGCAYFLSFISEKMFRASHKYLKPWMYPGFAKLIMGDDLGVANFILISKEQCSVLSVSGEKLNIFSEKAKGYILEGIYKGLLEQGKM